MRYRDRNDAALTLIPLLEKYRDDNAVVLAVPRGGVPVGYVIAKHFDFPLELLMTKKIGHPYNPEFAIGAVSMEDFILDDDHDESSVYVQEEIKRIRKNLDERYKKFMGDRQPADLANRTLIIVDDGIATGNTLRSSVPMLRKRKPSKIVVAVPVAPPQSVARIRNIVDDFICPYTPADFFGVGYHYADFSEVTDQEVIRLMEESGRVKAGDQ